MNDMAVILWNSLLVGEGSRQRQTQTLEPVYKVLVNGDKGLEVKAQGPQSEGPVKDGHIKKDLFF